MSKHDKARRKFLVGAAVGAGALASGGVVPQALAKGREGNAHEHHKTDGAGDAAGSAHMGIDGHGAFFNDEDAATIAAFAERLMPGAPNMPGATDANVINYIDLALSGAYADMQDFYRRGLAQLDAYCRSTYKQSFTQLDAAKQDEVITALEGGKATAFAYPTAQAFFATLRTHTMEGMFADPVYGGNRDFAGWRLVGFPGAQPVFTEADMHSKEAFTRIPMMGLQQSKAKGPGKRS